MSQIIGWYYLHTNGKLIYKNNPDAIADIRDSDFCTTSWPWTGERKDAWNILVEALALGVSLDRIKELAEKWSCSEHDAETYAQRLHCVLGEDGSQKTAKKVDFVNPQESDCGFGDTYLEAMADLCKQLGYHGGKMWNETFETLLHT